MKLRWLPEAWDDIQRLFTFLVANDPVAAAHAMEVIANGADRLLDNPGIGKPMDDASQRREVFLRFGSGSCVLRYRLDGEFVVIIRAWHGRERRR